MIDDILPVCACRASSGINNISMYNDTLVVTYYSVCTKHEGCGIGSINLNEYEKLYQLIWEDLTVPQVELLNKFSDNAQHINKTPHLFNNEDKITLTMLLNKITKQCGQEIKNKVEQKLETYKK